MQRAYNLGQYIHGDSLLHKASPKFKIIFGAAFAYMIFSTQSMYEFFLLAAFIISVSIHTGLGIKDFKRIIKFSRVFIYFSLFAGLFKYSESYIFEFYIFKLSWEGLLISLQSAVRVISMIMVSVLITRTTSIVDFIRIFDVFKKYSDNKVFKRIGDLGLITVLSLRFIPLIFEEANRIKIAQTSRGVNFETKSLKKLIYNYSYFLAQLMISTIKRAEIITLAIVNKGYGGPIAKNVSIKFSFNTSDVKLGIITAILIILMLYI